MSTPWHICKIPKLQSTPKTLAYATTMMQAAVAIKAHATSGYCRSGVELAAPRATPCRSKCSRLADGHYPTLVQEVASRDEYQHQLPRVHKSSRRRMLGTTLISVPASIGLRLICLDHHISSGSDGRCHARLWQCGVRPADRAQPRRTSVSKYMQNADATG